MGWAASGLRLGIGLPRSSSAGPGGSESGTVSGGALQAPVSPATKAEVQRLTAAVSASQSHTLDSFKIASAIALGIITMVSFGLSWWIAGRALAPVHRITDAREACPNEPCTPASTCTGPNDELKQLADTFDAMLGRLERAFTSQRRFVANASARAADPAGDRAGAIDEAWRTGGPSPEDLRTILEQLRVNSEDTERLIDACSHSPAPRRHRALDTRRPLVRSRLSRGPIGSRSGRRRRDGVLDARTRGGTRGPGLLERLAGNLVENAIRHNVTAAAAISVILM